MISINFKTFKQFLTISSNVRQRQAISMQKQQMWHSMYSRLLPWHSMSSLKPPWQSMSSRLLPWHSMSSRLLPWHSMSRNFNSFNQVQAISTSSSIFKRFQSTSSKCQAMLMQFNQHLALGQEAQKEQCQCVKPTIVVIHHESRIQNKTTRGSSSN